MEENSDHSEESSLQEKTNTKSWLGTSIGDLCRNSGPWNFYTTPLKASSSHHVLFELPLTAQTPPIPRYNSGHLAWDDNHVRMPFSPKNLFPVKENGTDVLKSRWEIIKKSLKEPIHSSRDLERAISQYSTNLPKFLALHYFFEDVLEDEEATQFFTFLLPGIIDLALDLPEILPSNLPLLKQNHNKSVSLSQVQIASLLANAFLCTFPWRKDVASNYPGVNFARLFAAHSRPNRRDCVVEKFKCICHYFRRVLSKYPAGVVTFERKYIPKSSMPRWDALDKNLGNTRIHIDSNGTIEDNGHGFLQIDFANRNIGGGVLGYGCVQEEIRFVICPELIISRLFVEQLSDNEAIVITGVERYSKYTGYGNEFKWAGNFIDETPFDDFGRRRTTISVIDATRYPKPVQQFYPSAILRELNKAYVGFSSNEKNNLAPVATGNWGCGAFQGNSYLKSLIQLIACCAANRDLVYFSFGNTELRDDFYDMHTFFGTHRITASQVWNHLSKFINAKISPDRLYLFLQQSYFDLKNQPSVRDFFKRVNTDMTLDIPSTSKKKDKSSSEEYDDSDKQELSQISNLSDDIIQSSQVSDEIPIEPVRSHFSKKKLPQNHDDILRIIDSMDGASQKSKTSEVSSLLLELDKVKKKQRPNDLDDIKIDIEDSSVTPMDVEDSDLSNSIDTVVSQRKSAGKKITDYFLKVGKPS